MEGIACWVGETIRESLNDSGVFEVLKEVNDAIDELNVSTTRLRAMDCNAGKLEHQCGGCNGFQR